MDIFIMNADGSNVRQLTDVPGYDGGPFFSADGKKICWRRFTEDGLSAEIMTMNIDGSEQRQRLTKHQGDVVGSVLPSVRRVSDLHDEQDTASATSNSIIVRADGGEGEPVRVTYTDKFDGLPVFTPDGKKLSWTTQRGSSGNSQIFLAEWDHKSRSRNAGVGVGSSKELRRAVVTGSPDTRPEFAPADVVQHVEYLCQPKLNGRMTGTEGAKLATQYVASYFDALGTEASRRRRVDWYPAV